MILSINSFPHAGLAKLAKFFKNHSAVNHSANNPLICDPSMICKISLNILWPIWASDEILKKYSTPNVKEAKDEN